MKYPLDTTVISDYVRGHPGVHHRLSRCAPAELAVSAVTVMEIEYGLARNVALAARVRPVVEARETGRLRGELSRSGKPSGPFDALIAGAARSHRLIVVTSNLSEFRRVPGLSVKDWREFQVQEADA